MEGYGYGARNNTGNNSPFNSPTPAVDMAPALSCGQPGYAGNSKGVGKFCSKSGNECNGAMFARYCELDFVATAMPICTGPCSTDADCGEGAACTTTPIGKGCQPMSCSPPVPDGGATSAASGPCGQAGNPGNSKGVGKFCTKGGSECKATPFAHYCSLDFIANAPAICTAPCMTDADCGEGATCVSGSIGKSCEPTSCIGMMPTVPPTNPNPNPNPPPPPPPPNNGGGGLNLGDLLCIFLGFC
jgi:hypothetical protein